MAEQSPGTLYFFCGKMGAGKSTHSVKLASEQNAVLLSEDAWLAQTYPNQIATFDDYLKFSNQLRPLVRNLVQDILRTGTSVVMDFPANTASQRSWFKNLCGEISAPHEMIYLQASNETCLRHIARRREEQPERAAFDTEEVFMQVTRFFEEPTIEESLKVSPIKVDEKRCFTVSHVEH